MFKLTTLVVTLCSAMAFASEAIPYNLNCKGKNAKRQNIVLHTDYSEGHDMLVRTHVGANGKPVGAASRYWVTSFNQNDGRLVVNTQEDMSFAGSGQANGILDISNETHKGTWIESFSSFNEAHGMNESGSTTYKVTCSVAE